jgi:hypothetical protein
MANFTNFNRFVTAAVGALFLSTAFITAAAGPAYAVEPTVTFAAVQAPVSAQADA